MRIRDFSLDAEGMQDDLAPVKEKFQDAFIRVWNRQAENDGFNRLVLGAELEWDEVVVLRAYAKYLRQVGVTLSETLHPADAGQASGHHAQHHRSSSRTTSIPALGDVGHGTQRRVARHPLADRGRARAASRIPTKTASSGCT